VRASSLWRETPKTAPAEVIKMGDLIDRYIDHCERRNLRPTYVNNQRLALHRLTAALDPLTATTAELETYLDGRALQPASRATEIAYLRGFYTWALDEGLILCSPARKVARPRIPVRLPRPMPDTDIRRALAEAPCEVAPILSLAVYAGLRACEIAQLRAEDFRGAVLVVRESKGGGESTVPISPTLAGVLARCPLPDAGWLFPSRRGPGHLSRSRICQLANDYLRSLGIAHTLHSLRHGFGTALYRSTHDLRLTQELMRHRSVQSTVGYTRLDPHDGATAVAALAW
jgi:integrase